MIKIRVKNFSLEKTMNSGSPITFIFNKVGNEYYFPFDKIIIKVRQIGEECGYSNLIVDYFPKAYSTTKIKQVVSRTFDLSFDYDKFVISTGQNKIVRLAIQHAYGIRVTQTEPWETLLCMVVSQQNRIAQIRNTIQKFMKHFGNTIVWNKKAFYTFPTYDDLYKTRKYWKNGFSLGYRYKYVKYIVEQLHNHIFDLKKLELLDYTDAKKELMKLYGVGDKIADAVLVFGYGKREGFIIDTWIKKIMEKYFIKKPSTTKEIHDFAFKKWKNYSSYVNQAMYFSHDVIFTF